ncbi:triose-phosphate isomerase [Levilactobacillus bambusae]|uniref:Triosephosphate isomerase n=1 Tax=Levilactobacillus bambusae TaxID=2024736 RepID=A0A2V1MZ72_9LACO|nr:triose-phosphate isomerase [Levilactobacillus bambusae]PWF99445.1 triose-phosphate isomerase [Levilactobacillus bambusae]
MRTPFIAGNWKMNKTLDTAKEFMQEVAGQLPDPTEVETAIAAPYLFIESMMEVQTDKTLKIGAENCYFEDSGAYTGEISPLMLADMGVHYTIIGHSERRKYFNETDDIINKKILAVYRNHMVPILCCNETMGRRESGEKIHWVVSQVAAALKGVSEEDAKSVVIAYEPSWAIGTGDSATADQAEEGCYLIRQTIADLYSDELADGIRVLYGGSVTPKNVVGLMAKQNIDGILAGGSSLKSESFIQLANYQKLAD